MASLQDLIELARTYEMSPSEAREQIESFAYGNTHFENETITRDDVTAAVDTIPNVELK